MTGFIGAAGKAIGSGVRRKTMYGLVGVSTDNVADQDVSPDSLVARHVNRPVSDVRKSEQTVTVLSLNRFLI